MAVGKLSVAKYILFGCAFLGMVGWNVHLQYSHQEHDEGWKKSPMEDSGIGGRKRRSVDGQSPPSQSGLPGGAVYIRWGRTVCPDDDSELVYSGIAGGAHHKETGGGAEYLCLSRETQYHSQSTKAVENMAKIHGVEFEAVSGHMSLFDTSNIEPSGLENADVVCAVCRSKARVSQVMIPGRQECYTGWKREYWGYLMTEYNDHKAWNSYACVDQAPEAEEGGSRDDSQGKMHLVQGICGSLPCPHYVNGMELTCVVCTK